MDKTPSVCCREYKVALSLWKLRVAPQEAKYRISVGSSNSTPGYIPKRNENRDSTCLFMGVYNKGISTTVRRWKQPKCPSIEEEMVKLTDTEWGAI